MPGRELVRRFVLAVFLTLFVGFAFPASAVRAAFTFASIGDAQGASAFLTTVKQIYTLNPALVIFNGDLENDGVTDTEMNTMAGYLKTAGIFDRTFLVRGNHDNHTNSDNRTYNAGLWESYFSTSPNVKTIPAGVTDYVAMNPNTMYPSSTYLNYSFVYDNSIFIGLDVPGGVSLLTSDQLAFLDTRLAYAEGRGLQHAFIFWHGPIYCVESTHCSCSARTDARCTPTSLVTLVNKHPIISAFFHGHEHILGWAHMDKTRLSGLTGSFEEFITSPSGGGTYNQYMYPDRMDYYYPDMGSYANKGFATIEVNGSSFTFNIFKVGTTAPVYHQTFSKGSVPTVTPGGPTITPIPPTSVPVNTPTSVPAPNITATLIKTTNTYQFSPVSPDPAGITYLSNTGRLLIADSEVEEIPALFTGMNLFETSFAGVLSGTGKTTSFSNEPTGVSYNPDDNKLYVTDDDKKAVFTLSPGLDNRFGTADDSYTSFSTLAFAPDPEGVAYAVISGQKFLFIADGVNKKVFKVDLATNSPVGSFDLSGIGFSDLEGIAFYKHTGTLYVLDLPAHTVAEVRADGSLVRKINIPVVSQANFNLGDLILAPASNNTSAISLYLVDRGGDNTATNPNENDGKLYEMSIPISVPPVTIVPTFAPGTISFEAEYTGNTLGGAAVVAGCGACSGGSKVGYVGNGPANTLQFNKVSVPATGTYSLSIYYINGETTNDRAAYLSVNSGSRVSINYAPTGGWGTVGTKVVSVVLNAGDNLLKFGNDTAYAPDFDRITLVPESPPAAQAYPGDANGDQIVNEADYDIWKSFHIAYYGQYVTGPDQGDFSDSAVRADNKATGLDYAIWLNHFSGNTPVPTALPSILPPTPGGPANTPVPTLPPSGNRKTKYYVADRVRNNADFAKLAGWGINTAIVAFDVNGTETVWRAKFAEAAKYNIGIVVWPSDWTYPRTKAACNWEAPYPPSTDGDISRVTRLLDVASQYTNFIGIVNAHESEWTCKGMTIDEMAGLKDKLKAYAATKGRSIKVWNYINAIYNANGTVSTGGYLPDSAVSRIMDVALTWKHCAGGAEGTCHDSGATSWWKDSYLMIQHDRARLNSLGLDGVVDYVFLMQTFTAGSPYTVKFGLGDLQKYSCEFLGTSALDGFAYYTWDAGWYTGDLSIWPDLQPAVLFVHNNCVVKN